MQQPRPNNRLAGRHHYQAAPAEVTPKAASPKAQSGPTQQYQHKQPSYRPTKTGPERATLQIQQFTGARTPAPEVYQNSYCENSMSASCRFALPTCYTLLQDAKQFANTKVPLSIVFRPFAEPKGYEPPVPVIDHSKGGLIRCTRCNSFLNPFYTFSGDRTFVCNLCDMKNELPPGVSLSSLDQNEVKAAVYDIIMPKEFHMKPMVKPYLLFCIELTKPFIELGSSSS